MKKFEGRNLENYSFIMVIQILNFLHTLTIVQRRHNNISQIKIPDGEWVHDRIKFGEYFVENYKHLLSTEPMQLRDKLNELTNHEVVEAKHDRLIEILDTEEIYQTLKAKNP